MLEAGFILHAESSILPIPLASMTGILGYQEDVRHSMIYVPTASLRFRQGDLPRSVIVNLDRVHHSLPFA